MKNSMNYLIERLSVLTESQCQKIKGGKKGDNVPWKGPDDIKC